MSTSSSSASSPWSGSRACRSGPFPRRSLEVGAIVVGFVYWWPLAVAYVAWKIAGYPALGSVRELARTGNWQGAWQGAWQGSGQEAGSSTEGRPQSRFARAFEAAREGGFREASGNAAFDAYRRAEIEKLEARRRALQEESRAFTAFVEELRRAKDREQFDAFMAKRRAEGGGSTIDV